MGSTSQGFAVEGPRIELTGRGLALGAQYGVHVAHFPLCLSIKPFGGGALTLGTEPGSSHLALLP